MTSYVFIASKGPWDEKEQVDVFELACSLSRSGITVTIYLTADAVRAACAGDGEHWLRPSIEARVRLWVDPAALQEQGIDQDRLVRRLPIVTIEDVCHLMAA